MDAVISDVEARGTAGAARVEDVAPARDAGSPAWWLRVFRELSAGRREALEELYDASAGLLYGLALWRTGSAEDAADVVQEVFVRVAEQHDRLAAVRNPRAWLLTVTRRAAVDVVRRRRRRPSRSLDDCRLLEAADEQLDRRLDGRTATALVARLPPKQRDVIYLRHFAGCGFAVIGSIVGVPTFTAASRYRLGMSKLQKLLEETP